MVKITLTKTGHQRVQAAKKAARKLWDAKVKTPVPVKKVLQLTAKGIDTVNKRKAKWAKKAFRAITILPMAFLFDAVYLTIKAPLKLIKR